MKKIKKIISIMLVAVMALAMSMTAFAQTVGNDSDGTGSITVKNAAKGETYKVFKLFDATLVGGGVSEEGKGIAYKGDIPESLTNIFEKDSAGNIHIKDVSEEGVTKAVAEWAKSQDKAGVSPTAQAKSDGSELVFKGIPYGYYAVTTTQGATVTIDSTKPDVTIVDKNPKTPTAQKEIDKDNYSVGDTVTYTATFNTPNYLGEATSVGNSEQVVSYVIKDTLPDFLSDVMITSVKIVKNAGQENEKLLEDLSASYPAFNDKKEISIPWVDETVPTTNHKYTNKYDNGAQIVITYTAVVTSNAQIGAANVNQVSLIPNVDRGSGPKPYTEEDKWNDTAEFTTHAAALQKTDESENNLPGAEFAFNGLIVTGSEGMYTVVSYDPDSTELGTVMKCDSNGKLVIGGINKDLILIGTETKAPDGYNKMKDTFELPTILMEKTTKTSWENKTTYYDAEGNIVDEEVEGGTSITETVYNKIEEIPANSVLPVENHKGSLLPSTGGIGTTIFYIVGAILVIGAGIILVAKKRMSHEQ